MKAHTAGMLGIAPHSGWAAAVLVAGTPAEPRVMLRERLELSDARHAGSKQPYHELEGLPLAQAQRQLARLCASASGLAQSALRALLERAQAAGVKPRAAGILDSSGRSGATLAEILASHALIHTADGNHFREALAQGCQAMGLRVTRIPQRELTGHGAGQVAGPACRDGHGAGTRDGIALGRRSEGRRAARLAAARGQRLTGSAPSPAQRAFSGADCPPPRPVGTAAIPRRRRPSGRL